LSSLLFVPALLAACSRNELGAVEFDPVDTYESKDPETFGAWTSFDTSPDGTKLTMSYYDRSKSALGYAVGTANPDNTFAWIHEPVDGYIGDNGLDSGDRGKYSSQRTLADGTVWIAYQDTTNRVLRAAHRLGPGNWEEPAGIDGAGTGAWASMALDADGNPLVVHCVEGGIVRETRWNGSEWVSKDLYTSSAGEVEHTRVLVQGGKEYVAFRDAGVGHLHLLTNGRDELVDAGGDTGAWPTLVVDGDDRWLAYQDVGNQDLKLATSEGGGRWEIQTIDAGELRGADTDLQLVDGSPEILYFDGFDNDLRVARRDGNAWSTERLSGESVAAGFHNRAVTFGGNRYWFTFDYTNETLLSGRL
jgi:hypothetical protein